MRGGSSTVADGTPDYGPVAAAFIFAQIKGLQLEQLAVLWPESDPAAPAPERQVIYGDHLDGVAIRGLQGGASVSGAKPVIFERSINVQP